MALDPVRNPDTPGAGQAPAVMSGRDTELSDFTARLRRLETGRSAQCTLIVGLRGVGKTVLLNRFAHEAQTRQWIVVDHELSARGDFFATTARLARDALHQLAPPTRWQRAGRRVASILTGMEVTYQIAGLSVTSPAATGTGTGTMVESTAHVSGDQARDLTELLLALGQAAQDHERGLLLVLDELQFAPVEPLGALIAGLHKVAQRVLPLTLVAAGLPQTRGVLAEAATYSERMFETRTPWGRETPSRLSPNAPPRRMCVSRRLRSPVPFASPTATRSSSRSSVITCGGWRTTSSPKPTRRRLPPWCATR